MSLARCRGEAIGHCKGDPSVVGCCGGTDETCSCECSSCLCPLCGERPSKCECTFSDVLRQLKPSVLPTPCDQCRKGWVPDGSWFQPCPICEGLGELTLTRLATLVDVDEATLKGLWTMRRKTRKRTALKVLDAYAKLTQSKQPELFR